jgi:hypothetical protein
VVRARGPPPDTLVSPLEPPTTPVVAAPLMAVEPDDCPDESDPVLEINVLPELPQAAQATTSHDTKAARLGFIGRAPSASG